MAIKGEDRGASGFVASQINAFSVAPIFNIRLNMYFWVEIASLDRNKAGNKKYFWPVCPT